MYTDDQIRAAYRNGYAAGRMAPLGPGAALDELLRHLRDQRQQLTVTIETLEGMRPSPTAPASETRP